MTRVRKALATAGVGILLLGTMGATDVDAPTTGDGRSLTELQLLQLGLTDVPLLSDVDAALGTLSSLADGSGDGAAQLLFDGATIGDQTVAERRFESGSGSEEAIDLGALGSLSLLDYAVSSAPRDATARLGALTGGLDLPILDDLAVSLGQGGLTSVVSDDGTSSVTGLRIDGLGLDVGDLLGADVLGELPLGVVLDLLDDLPITLPTDLAGAVAILEGLPAQLTQALALEDASVDALDDLLSELGADTLTDALADIADLEALIATLEGEEADLLADLTEVAGLLEAQLLAALLDLDVLTSCDVLDVLNYVPCLRDELTATLTGLLDDVRDALAPLTAELLVVEGLLDTVEGLVAQLTTLLDQITAQLGLLPDLDDLLDDLTGLLAGAPLFDIGELVVGVTTGATSAGGTAAATCQVGALSVLGQTAPLAGGCDALGGALAPVEAVIGDLLDTLLGALPVPDVLSVGGLVTSTQTGTGDDGTTTGQASISALTTSLASVDLVDVLDGLTDTLDGLTGELTGALDGLVDLGLLDGVLGSVGTASTAGFTTAAVPGLDDLTGLLGQLDALPLGDGLGGLSTLGLDLELAGLSALSSFAPDQATAPETPGGDGPGGDGPGGDGPGGDGPGTDTPGTDTPDGGTPVVPELTSSPGTTGGTPTGDLPRTGGGLTSLLGLALLGGAAIPRWRRG